MTTHRRASKRAVAAVVALAVAGASFLGFAATHQGHAPAPSLSNSPAGSQHGPPAHTTEPAMGTSLPQSLDIPALGVRANLLQLGQGNDGAVAVPPPGPTYDQPGWYRYSPTPGALGPAVILGHVDSAQEGPSVFFRLGALKPHDVIRVTRIDGTVAVFAVDEVSRYRKATFPTELVYGDVDHAALRLITCGGPFDHASGSYEDNVVVLASLVGST